MESLSVSAAVEKIHLYLKRDTLYPYFVISDGDADFKKIFGDFKQMYIADFCAGDCPLDIDLLVEKLNMLPQNALVFGLGEYIFFTGQENILRSLQDRNFNRKVVFVCRGIANLLERLADEDVKFRTNHICRIEGGTNLFVVKYSPAVGVPTEAQNFSELLKLLAGGKNSATVKTNLPLKNVREINTFYDAIKSREPHFNALPDALSDTQWQEYFFNDNCDGYAPEHWRRFAAGFKHKISNPYLRFVFNRSANFEAYRKNLFFALFDVNDAKAFDKFYALRKVAVRNILSPYLAEYLERLTDVPDAVKYLTDNTAEERRAMIEAVQGKEKIPDTLKRNFPAMNDYLADYDFGDVKITNYFRQYKKIKLCNVETRQKIPGDADPTAKLYWLDALGVEFLIYISARAA